VRCYPGCDLTAPSWPQDRWRVWRMEAYVPPATAPSRDLMKFASPALNSAAEFRHRVAAPGAAAGTCGRRGPRGGETLRASCCRSRHARRCCPLGNAAHPAGILRRELAPSLLWTGVLPAVRAADVDLSFTPAGSVCVPGPRRRDGVHVTPSERLIFQPARIAPVNITGRARVVRRGADPVHRRAS